MKKFLAALLLVLPISVMAEEFGLNIPEWKDFAPSAFVDVKEPKGLGKLNVTAKYWYDRKVAFEEAKKVKEESVDIIDDSIKGIGDSDITGEVEVSEEEQKDIISEEISEIEAQTPLTTYVEPVENLDEEDDVDYELNISDKQKAAVDRAYEEIIDEALRQVNDPDMLTNKEVNKCVRICCAHIIRNCKNINKKDIKEYIRSRVINDSIMNSKNIDNF